MKKLAGFFLIVFIALITSFGTYKLSYFLGEKYFFDKLFYKKSAEHGYLNIHKGNYSEINNKAVLKRIADISLITQNKNEDDQVLGLSTNQEYKIAVIGDSFVYGIGIRSEERFSKVLEDLLDKKRPTKVYSLGLPGDNILEHLAKYKLAENKLKPDLVILGIVNNDFIIDQVDIYPGQLELFLDLRSRCPGEVLRYNWGDPSLRTFEEMFLEGYYPSATDRYSNACILLEALSEMDVAKTIFFPITRLPTREVALPTKYKDREQELTLKELWVMQRYRDLIKKTGGLILPYDYSEFPLEIIEVSEQEGHYSKFTNEQIAETLYQEIITNPRWGFID